MNQILYVPDPILRQTSENIKKITSKEIDISKKMIDLMLKAPGVGLAANQIGILKKIVTINLPNENSEKNKIYTLFNPIITSYSKKKVIMEEGCLSYPDEFIEVERSETVVVKYEDENKVDHKVKLEGFAARVFLHEFDHMQGINFTQRER